MLNNFLHQRYSYGGKIMYLGDIIIDLQNTLKDQAAVDAYLCSLFATQEPINPIENKLNRGGE